MIFTDLPAAVKAFAMTKLLHIYLLLMYCTTYVWVSTKVALCTSLLTKPFSLENFMVHMLHGMTHSCEINKAMYMHMLLYSDHNLQYQSEENTCETLH